MYIAVLRTAQGNFAVSSHFNDQYPHGFGLPDIYPGQALFLNDNQTDHLVWVWGMSREDAVGALKIWYSQMADEYEAMQEFE